MYNTFKNIHEKKRLNRVGNFLRKYGLDELPQLFNILENKMSFVGSRPLLIEYLEKYSKFEKKRHLVKSSGAKPRNMSIKLDIYYVKNVSFFLDIQILFKTIKLILFEKKQCKDFKKFYEQKNSNCWSRRSWKSRGRNCLIESL